MFFNYPFSISFRLYFLLYSASIICRPYFIPPCRRNSSWFVWHWLQKRQQLASDCFKWPAKKLVWQFQSRQFWWHFSDLWRISIFGIKTVSSWQPLCSSSTYGTIKNSFNVTLVFLFRLVIFLYLNLNQLKAPDNNARVLKNHKQTSSGAKTVYGCA